MQFSREKASKAQPKESLSTLSKTKITITNYLGGQYFFTVDEIIIDRDIVYLIEGKHSKQNILPSKGDIKDGLLKMILYSNLSEVEIRGIKMESHAVLNLTSTRIIGEITSESSITDIDKFFVINNLKYELKVFISELFKEADENNFTAKIGYAK